MKVYAVFDPPDRAMAPDHDEELQSLWSTQEKADAEANRLKELNGWPFVVRAIGVDPERSDG